MNGVALEDWAFLYDGDTLLNRKAEALPRPASLRGRGKGWLEPIERTLALRNLAKNFASHLPRGWSGELVLAHGKPLDHFPQAVRQSLAAPQIYIDDGIGAVEWSRRRLEHAFTLRYRLGVEVPRYREKWHRSRTWQLLRSAREIIHWALMSPNSDTAVLSDHFTAFPVVSRTPERVAYNSYSHLRAQLPAAECVRPLALFLGQPHVQQGRVSFDHYIAGIRYAMARASANLRWTYLLHPEDSDSHGQVIAETVNIKVRRGHVCAEFDIPRSGGLPQVVAGFNSSALGTLPVLLGDKTAYMALRFPPEAAGKAWFDEAITFYSDLKAAALGVLEIVDIPVSALAHNGLSLDQKSRTDELLGDGSYFE